MKELGLDLTGAEFDEVFDKFKILADKKNTFSTRTC